MLGRAAKTTLYASVFLALVYLIYLFLFIVVEWAAGEYNLSVGWIMALTIVGYQWFTKPTIDALFEVMYERLVR